MFEMKPVTSSMITAMGHDNKNRLRVEFSNGAAYEYDHVSKAEFETILSADSVGKSFQYIKNNPSLYPVQKV